MSHYQVFVDGAAGTTGLRIQQRLASQPDIALHILPEEERKNPAARISAIQNADISILCLPDAAATEIAAVAGPNARIIDASTAHRTNPAWVYGFPELGARREPIKSAARVSVPGCHATGFLALAAPLVEKGVLPPDTPLTCHSLTGYSGGGRQMIEAYESPARPSSYDSPRLYGLPLTHKHLPEMQQAAGLPAPPLFCPVVADFYSGMLATLPLSYQSLTPSHRSPSAIESLYRSYYQNQPLISIHPATALPEDGTLAANGMAGKDALEIFILGNEQQLLLAARFDNLGKGASGAAIQCMNLMLGREETAGLTLQTI